MSVILRHVKAVMPVTLPWSSVLHLELINESFAGSNPFLSDSLFFVKGADLMEWLGV